MVVDRFLKRNRNIIKKAQRCSLGIQEIDEIYLKSKKIKKIRKIKIV